MTVAEIIRFTWNLALMFLCYAKLGVKFLVYTIYTAHILGYTKLSQYVTANGEKIFKTCLSACESIAVTKLPDSLGISHKY